MLQISTESFHCRSLSWWERNDERLLKASHACSSKNDSKLDGRKTACGVQSKSTERPTDSWRGFSPEDRLCGFISHKKDYCHQTYFIKKLKWRIPDLMLAAVDMRLKAMRQVNSFVSYLFLTNISSAQVCLCIHLHIQTQADGLMGKPDGAELKKESPIRRLWFLYTNTSRSSKAK